MAYDERLAGRTRPVLGKLVAFTEKQMFGGIAFLVNGNMGCGVVNRDLVPRLTPELAERAMGEAHVRAMDFTGRPMKSMVYVGEGGTADGKALGRWVKLAVGVAQALPAKPGKGRRGSEK